MIRLRKYQKKAVKDIINFYNSKNNKRVISVLPTGSGKSHIIAEVVKLLKVRTIIIQPSKELLEQNYNKYIIYGNAKIYSASMNSKEIGDVTFVTPLSVKNKADLFENVELILIDEAHLMTNSYGVIDTFINNLEFEPRVIGLTATPIKLKNYVGDFDNYSQLNILTKIRPRFWQDIIHVTQVKELYDEKFLTPLRFSSFSFDRNNLKMRGHDYDEESISKEMEIQGNFELGVELIKESIKRGKKKILVFTASVNDSIKLKQRLRGIEIITAKTPKKERTEIVNRFKNGDLKVLSNYGTLVVGFDVPEIDLIIMMRPTQSYALYYQMLGRGIRIAPNKEICDVIDLSGNYKVFKGIEDLSIENHPTNGWSMFAKNYLITGVPIGAKIHRKNLNWKEKEIPFGKYKGTKYKDVPGHYLKYIAENFDLNNDYARKFIKPALKALNYI